MTLSEITHGAEPASRPGGRRLAEGVVSFGDFELNRSSMELRRRDRPVFLQPKVFRLLSHLVDHPHRVVTKRELLDTLWPAETVVPAVLTTAVRSLRRALGDDRRATQYVRTVHSIGYQFIAPICNVRPKLAAARLRALPRTGDFIGRDREIAAFRAGVGDPAGPVRVLLLHGPAGIGKTHLLHELALVGAERGVRTTRLSAEHIVPSPDGFWQALRAALDAQPADASSPASDAQVQLIVVDNYEKLCPLDRWLRETVLSTLTGRIRLMLVGRLRPNAAWRAEQGFGDQIQELELQPFAAAECRRFLAARNVGAEQAPELFRRTGGHPLSLALAADSLARGAAFDLAVNVNVISALVERFVGVLPGLGHRDALVAASLSVSFDEPLLAATLGESEAYAYFEWLSTLSFVERTSRGASVHALVREAVISDTRMRNPQRLHEILERAVSHWSKLVAEAKQPAEKVGFSALLIDCGRHHPLVRPFIRDEEALRLRLEPAAAGMHRELAAMVETHEGADAGSIARRWLELQPRDTWVVRNEQDESVGFVQCLLLDHTHRGAAKWDPVISLIFEHLDEVGLKPGERVLVHRYLVARDTYQDVSGTMQLCHEMLYYNCCAHLSSEQRVAHAYIVYGEPEVWRNVNRIYCSLFLPGHRLLLGGRRFGFAYQSFRDCTLERWFERVVRSIAYAGEPETSA